MKNYAVDFNDRHYDRLCYVSTAALTTGFARSNDVHTWEPDLAAPASASKGISGASHASWSD